GRGVGEELAVVLASGLGADPLAEVLWYAARQDGDVDAGFACELVLRALEREHAGQAGRHVGAGEIARHALAEVEQVTVDAEEELARRGGVGAADIDLTPGRGQVVEA